MKYILKFLIYFLTFTNGSFIKSNTIVKTNIIVKSKQNNNIKLINLQEINNYKLIDKILDIKIENTKNLGRLIVEKTSCDSNTFFTNEIS